MNMQLMAMIVFDEVIRESGKKDCGEIALLLEDKLLPVFNGDIDAVYHFLNAIGIYRLSDIKRILGVW